MFMNVDANGGAAFRCDLFAVADISKPRCGRVDETRGKDDGGRDYRSCKGTASYLVHAGYDFDIPI